MKKIYSLLFILIFSSGLQAQNITGDTAKIIIKFDSISVPVVKSDVITDSVKAPVAVVPKKLGDHAPAFDDPDYAAKKSDWVNKYPDEYKKALEVRSNNPSPNNNDTIQTSDRATTSFIALMKQLKATDPAAYKAEMDRLQTADPVRYKIILDAEKQTEGK